MSKSIVSSEVRRFIDRRAKKAAAIAALREINRLIDVEERELRAGRRMAGILTGILFGSVFGAVLFFLVARRMHTVKIAALTTTDVAWVSIFCLITVLSFAGAYYIKTTGPRRGWRILGVGFGISMGSAAIILAWLALLGML